MKVFPENLRVGVIGFGEVGSSIAKGLKGAGISEIVAYNNGSRNKPPYTQAFQQKAERIGVRLVTAPKELAYRSDFILSTVIPTSSVAATKETAPFLTPEHLYIDLNSCSPETKKEGWNILKERGARYVDGVILGAPFKEEHRAQMFASGEGAQEFHDVMSKYGMNIRVVSGNIGDASLLKMIISVLGKGIQALLWESYLALHKAGLDPDIYKDLDYWLTDMGIFDQADELIGRSAIHAARRAGEMAFVGNTLRSLGIEPMMSEATEKRLLWCAGFNFKEYFPEGWPSGYKVVFEVMDKINQERGHKPDSRRKTLGQ